MRYLLWLLLLLATAAGAAPPHAVVFMYHRFGDDRFPSTNVTLPAFEAQLDLLEQGGFTIWPLERLAAALRNEAPIPDRTVAITVDDAYRSVYDNAFPRLKARGWPFTVFVSTDPVDQGLRDYMEWGQMREMQAAGVRFANHSAGHDHLVLQRPGEDEAAWRRRVAADLTRAEGRLQQELGPEANPGRLLAYPYGEFTAPLADLVAELGYTAFGQQSGALGAASDLRALPRYPVAERYSDLEAFALKAASLPLPVIRVTPWEPLVAENPPRLTVELAAPLPGHERLACYGGGRLPVSWLGPARFVVQAGAPYPPGRTRYNCTAPAGDGRWYWFSHPWLVPPIGATPAD